MKTNELFTTSDGSHSLLSAVFDVPYHSRHGALSETQHVFIDAGLKSKQCYNQVSILEIGFGTGLNAYMSFLEGKSLDLSIYYETIEAYPVEMDIVHNLNFAEQLNAQKSQFLKLHELNWNYEHAFERKFTFQKKLTTFQDFTTSHSFDVIYFDAFAPNAQPKLWETGFLSKMYTLLNEDGVLVTYCAQGQFKRNLKAIGFSIEALPGPIGKREMTRARK